MRTTVRGEDRAKVVKAMLENAGANVEDLDFFIADLTSDAGWAEAVKGCDYALHVASPFPAGAPKDENELIVPARDGTLRVLKASRDAGVKRVVMPSSFAAIGYGAHARNKVFDESDWSNVAGKDVQLYMKSKILAERAAWDFVAQKGCRLELTVINPVGVFGPVFGSEPSTSIRLIRSLLEGMPITPRLYFSVVDVRDLADLHLRAMTSPQANGERFLATAGSTQSLFEVAKILRRRLGSRAIKVPRFEAPDWRIRFMAQFSASARATVPQRGIIRRSTSAKAQRVLGWKPRPVEETIGDTGESLLRLGLVGSANR